MDRLLIVEDDDSLRDVITTFLETKNYAVVSAASAEEALEILPHSTFSCILCDFRLPGAHGIDLLRATRTISNDVPFVLMTAFGSIDIAVQALKLGANDFITKPFEPEILSSVVHDVIRHKRIIDRNLGTKTLRERRFLTQNATVQRLLAEAQKVARVDSSALILGQSGTGKELLARYLHEHSPRKDKPFVAINCAALPSELLESEFFGHEAGAFTGATQRRVGMFEYAAEGTIFLDEIGEMSLHLQVKLLRALQEGEIRRVGSNKVIKVSPRVLSATNIDIEDALESGKLREDLYYRIAVITLQIPPLVERPEDIDLLTRYYIDYFASINGGRPLQLDPTAQDMLHTYTWPGNARELENVIERAVILADGVIRPEHLGINIPLDIRSLDQSASTLQQVAALAARKAEVDLISRMLERTRGNKSKAARLLGVSYKTLLNKVKEYEIHSPTDEDPVELTTH